MAIFFFYSWVAYKSNKEEENSSIFSKTKRDIICRLKIHIMTAKSNYDCGPKLKQEGVKSNRSHLRGSAEQGRQLGAQLDGSRVLKVPAKICSQNELWVQMRKWELAKQRKKAEAKTKTP